MLTLSQNRCLEIYSLLIKKYFVIINTLTFILRSSFAANYLLINLISFFLIQQYFRFYFSNYPNQQAEILVNRLVDLPVKGHPGHEWISLISATVFLHYNNTESKMKLTHFPQETQIILSSNLFPPTNLLLLDDLKVHEKVFFLLFMYSSPTHWTQNDVKH